VCVCVCVWEGGGAACSAAARAGKTVVHLDRNNYYGGPFASFSFTELERLVLGTQRAYGGGHSFFVRSMLTELARARVHAGAQQGTATAAPDPTDQLTTGAQALRTTRRV
jgi:hypothetical protein